MPTYDFECEKCARVFEEMLPLGTKETPPCPACGSKDVRKLIAPPAIHFKGKGFYKTDSAERSPPPKKNTAEATSGTAAEKKPAPPEKSSKKDAK